MIRMDDTHKIEWPQIEWPDMSSMIEKLSEALRFESDIVSKMGISRDPQFDEIMESIRQESLIKAYRKTMITALLATLLVSAMIFLIAPKAPGSPRSD